MLGGLVITDTFSKIAFDKELFRYRIERLLFTEEGSLLGDPQWGSLLPTYFFEPRDTILIKDIIKEIEYLIKTFEERINLIELRVGLVGEAQGSSEGMIINVDYEIKDTGEVDQIQFFKVKSV